MTVDALYEKVTQAILLAERLEDEGDSSASRAAYLTVSFIEEDIAKHMPPSGSEGGIARRGAVRAATKAGISTRAEELVARYLAEPAPSALAEELRKMTAHAASPPEAQPVHVIPAARFHLHDS